MIRKSLNFFCLFCLISSLASCSDSDEKKSGDKLSKTSIEEIKDPIKLFEIDKKYNGDKEPRLIWVSGFANLPDDAVVIVELTGEPGKINSKTRLGTSKIAYVLDQKFKVPLTQAMYAKFPTGTYQLRSWLAPGGSQNPDLKIPKEILDLHTNFKAKMMIKIASPDKNQEAIKLAKTSLEIEMKTEKKALIKAFKYLTYTLQLLSKSKGSLKLAKSSSAKSLEASRKLAVKYEKKSAKYKAGNLRLTYSRVPSIYKQIVNYRDKKFALLASGKTTSKELEKLRKHIKRQITFRIKTVENDSFY